MTNRKEYNIIKEPSGRIYTELLSYSMNTCDKFSLVERNFEKSNEFQKAMEILEDFLIQKEKTNKWPGTELLSPSEHGIVNYYELNNQSIDILLNLSNRLYDWTYPERPEDLILIRKDGNPWLVTISHEEDAYFEMTEDEMKLICLNVEGLRDIIETTI